MKRRRVVLKRGKREAGAKLRLPANEAPRERDMSASWTGFVSEAQRWDRRLRRRRVALAVVVMVMVLQKSEKKEDR